VTTLANLATTAELVALGYTPAQAATIIAEAHDDGTSDTLADSARVAAEAILPPPPVGHKQVRAAQRATARIRVKLGSF